MRAYYQNNRPYFYTAATLLISAGLLVASAYLSHQKKVKKQRSLEQIVESRK